MAIIPEFRIWSSELGIAGPRDCPQTVYMLEINVDLTLSGAQISGKKSLGFLKFLEPEANSPYKRELISRIFDFSNCILNQVD